MIPISLSLHNFLSYGENVPPLDFTQFHVACLSGDNGHGKSAMLDAITYALWGEARKGQHERKPDDGLLRIGASEMRVEFCFALDEQQFRVLRSYRRRSSRGSAQLDLQIFDIESLSYRSLSEGDSLTRTQKRINQLLNLDYETFSNSAFIVQGRADAFTEKNARQRKAILSQILGLERYDQLQGLARTRFQDIDQRNSERLRRIAELDKELTESDQHTLALKEVTLRIEDVLTSLAKIDGDIETARSQLVEAEKTNERRRTISGELSDLGQRVTHLEKEKTHLEKQQRDDDELLRSEETIQSNFTTYQQLQMQVAQLDQATQALRTLENRRNEVKSQIVTARHQVEQRLQTHTTLRDGYETQLNETRILLAKEEQVEEAFSTLNKLRDKLQMCETERIRHEALLHEQTQLQHAIELEHNNLRAQQSSAAKKLEELNTSIAEGGALNAQQRQLQDEVEKLRVAVIERDRLKERGSALRAQIEEQQKQRTNTLQELEAERQRTVEAKSRSEDRCPLCGSELDEDHRKQLDEELLRIELERETQVDTLRGSIEALEKELETMRHAYRTLEEQTASVEDRQRALNACEVRIQNIQNLQEEARKQGDLLSAFDAQIAACAQSERERLVQVESDIKGLNYDRNAHEALQLQVDGMRQAELDHASLQSARTQSEHLIRQRNEANEKLELAQRYLFDKLYAQEEQAQLKSIEEEIVSLGYSEEKHVSLRKELDELSDVFTLQNNLQAARERRASNREALSRTEQSLAELRERREKLNRELDSTEDATAAIVTLKEHIADLQEQQAKQQQQRDVDMEQRGTLRAIRERETRLAAERKEVQAETEGDRGDAWIYQTLDEAFGKDGIQALIIESAVPQIETEANAILSRLTDNRIQISIESLRDLKTGGTRETLDIKISDEIGERPYHLYSGGEAFRTNFALRIALSKVLAIRAGTQLRTLVIDEGFGTQDSTGIDQLVEAIQEISRDFDKVLIVTHLPELKKVFPVQIEVVKHPDIGSRFTVVHNN
ncbi:MAG: AAA family ATPase [Candidatus Latescibacterota bacterium]